MITEAVVGSVVDFQACWAELELPAHVREVLSAAPLVQAPETRQQLLDWALGRATGETDWTLGNREDHGVYEAVFQTAGGAGGGGDYQGAEWPRDQFSRSSDAQAGPGCDGDWGSFADG